MVDSRLSREGRAVRRRRECAACGHRFTTYEQVEHEPLTVHKADASSEPFERSKLVRSLQIACAKRPVSREEIEAMTDEIEDSLQSSGDREVESERIGELAMSLLRDADQVAYVRYASVYRDFQDTTEFMEEVRELVRRAGYEAPGQRDLFSDGDRGDEV